MESINFGRQRILSRVGAIGSLNANDAAALRGAMSGVSSTRGSCTSPRAFATGTAAPATPSSSRAEFAELKARNLLTDATVLVHGVGLEPEDFYEMAHAPAARATWRRRWKGAKLVWSPLSNLLLYGKTAAVYDALAAGVLVSLGTDWTPSGSPNLLTELKVADRALRDTLLLGERRSIVPDLTAGHGDTDRGAAERALDQLLVEMVTINPATTVRWDDQVGSIEIGKAADLLVIDARSAPQKTRGNSRIAVPTIDRCHRTGCCARHGRRHCASGRRRASCHR